MGLAFLSIQGLTVSYGGKADVLRDVSLDVERGEVIGLIGPSGSGKSTILRTLVGLLKPRAGMVTLDGKLVDYQTIRDQAHILGKTESDGCCYADSWSSVQFQRMANVSMAPGKKPLSVPDLIKDVENGIYIIGDGSFSIDQQRYNAQFGGQLFYEIKNGQITRMLEDVAYQIRTPEFWNACTAVADERDYRLGGSFFDGKGQPGQVSAVSHGSSTARFNGINVINTARSLG